MFISHAAKPPPNPLKSGCSTSTLSIWTSFTFSRCILFGHTHKTWDRNHIYRIYLSIYLYIYIYMHEYCMTCMDCSKITLCILSGQSLDSIQQRETLQFCQSVFDHWSAAKSTHTPLMRSHQRNLADRHRSYYICGTRVHSARFGKRDLALVIWKRVRRGRLGVWKWNRYITMCNYLFGIWALSELGKSMMCTVEKSERSTRATFMKKTAERSELSEDKIKAPQPNFSRYSWSTLRYAPDSFFVSIRITFYAIYIFQPSTQHITK